MKTKFSHNQPQTHASGRLGERDGNLWIVLETPFNGSRSPQPGSLRQWFQIEDPDAVPAMLAGRPVRQLDPEQGLFVDEEGNSYRLAGGGRAEPDLTEVIPGQDETTTVVPAMPSAKGRRRRKAGENGEAVSNTTRSRESLCS